jgi:hypothetical protein
MVWHLVILAIPFAVMGFLCVWMVLAWRYYVLGALAALGVATSSRWVIGDYFPGEEFSWSVAVTVAVLVMACTFIALRLKEYRARRLPVGNT